jgi:hypothetical protein
MGEAGSMVRVSFIEVPFTAVLTLEFLLIKENLGANQWKWTWHPTVASN